MSEHDEFIKDIRAYGEQQPQPTEVVLYTAKVMVVGETRKPAVTIHPSGVFVMLPDQFHEGADVEIVVRLILDKLR